MLWARAHRVAAGTAIVLMVGCATQPADPLSRDASAPFQTSELAYQLTDDGFQWRLALPITYRNHDSLAQQIDYGGTVIQRREGSEWRTVYAPTGPLVATADLDSLAPGKQVEFSFNILFDRNAYSTPQAHQRLTGRYRTLVGLRERQTPSVDLIVWKSIHEIDRQRTNEFEAKPAH